MILNTILGFKDYIKNDHVNIGERLIKGMWETIFYFSVFVIGSNVVNIYEENLLSQINENVATDAGFEEFKSNAFEVTKENNKYYSTIFGRALKVGRTSPFYTSVSYEINQNLYEKFLRYVGVNYTENIGSMTNYYKKPDYWFGSIKSKFAVTDIHRQLEKVTEQKAISKIDYYSSKSLNNAIQNSIKNTFVVGNIGEVDIDKSLNKASFTIDLIDVSKNADVVAKRLLVVQDLTNEIEKNKQKAYEFYAEHFDKCGVTEIDLAKSNLKQLVKFETKIGTQVEAYIPELEF